MSQHHRTLSARPWQRTRRQILARAAGLCEIRNPTCCTTHATTVDHIIPLAAGGARLDPNNLRASCRACNQHRNTRLPHVDRTWTL